MKELSFLFLVSLFLPTGSPVGEIIAAKDTKLIDAIIYVESRGDSMAYNIGEDAVGVLQIRPIMLREVNRLLGYDRYNLKDRWSKAKSIEMFEIIKQNTGNPTDEILARNWNGGWKGYKKKSTLKYWNKVRKEL
tara:strand:+ start:3249 stop:3650 length:402 start_codon:yes stop_codon:yes gene_type:complete